MQTNNRGELQIFAAQFAERLTQQPDAATVVTLSGELGAGKTTFAQGVAKALGVEETVSSPTFVIEKVYVLEGSPPAGGWRNLIHIDAYRLLGAHQLEVLHWQELLADPANLILLEWPERVADAIPKRAIAIRFDIDGDGRIITINGDQKSKTD